MKGASSRPDWGACQELVEFHFRVKESWDLQQGWCHRRPMGTLNCQKRMVKIDIFLGPTGHHKLWYQSDRPNLHARIFIADSADSKWSRYRFVISSMWLFSWSPVEVNFILQVYEDLKPNYVCSMSLAKAQTLSVWQGVQVQDWLVISPFVMWLFSGSPVKVNYILWRFDAQLWGWVEVGP